MPPFGNPFHNRRPSHSGAIPTMTPFPYPPVPGSYGYPVNPYPAPPYHPTPGGYFPTSPQPYATPHGYMPASPYGAIPPSTPFGIPDPSMMGGALSRPKLQRPKETEEQINPWITGADYGLTLNPSTLFLLRPNIRIHPLLSKIPETSAQPRLIYDFLFPSSTARRSDDKPNKSWSNGREAPATYPKLERIRIISRGFPFTIEVRNPRGGGVTCANVIETIHQRLGEQLDRHTWENYTTPSHRDAMSHVYHHNRSTAIGVPGGILGDGMRCVEWLLDRTYFDGLEQDTEYVAERFGISTPDTFILLTNTRDGSGTPTPSSRNPSPRPPSPILPQAQVIPPPPSSQSAWAGLLKKADTPSSRKLPKKLQQNTFQPTQYPSVGLNTTYIAAAVPLPGTPYVPAAGGGGGGENGGYPSTPVMTSPAGYGPPASAGPASPYSYYVPADVPASRNSPSG